MDIFADWLAPFLSTGSLLALPLVIIGGLITAFNPCCLPMYPAVFGFLGGEMGGKAGDQPAEQIAAGEQTRTGLTRSSLWFVLGMATATSLMGLLTAALGWVFGQFGGGFRLLLAAIPLLMGLHLLGLLPLPALRLPALPRGGGGRHAPAFAAGLLFSLAIAPCATPILLGILSLVAMQGDLVYGGVLMFVYGLGAGLPLLLIGHGFERGQRWFSSPRHRQWLRQVSALLLLGVGVYLLWTA